MSWFGSVAAVGGATPAAWNLHVICQLCAICDSVVNRYATGNEHVTWRTSDGSTRYFASAAGVRTLSRSSSNREKCRGFHVQSLSAPAFLAVAAMMAS